MPDRSIQGEQKASWHFRSVRCPSVSLGRYDEAITQMSYAIELDPFNHFSRYWLAIIAFFSRQYEFTIKQLEILSNCDDAIGLSYAQRKRYPEAIASMQKCVTRQVRGQALSLGQLAQVYGLAG